MMATCIIQPIDMVKVRLQLGASGNPFKVASDIIKSDGARNEYHGVSAVYMFLDSVIAFAVATRSASSKLLFVYHGSTCTTYSQSVLLTKVRAGCASLAAIHENR